MNNTRDLIKTAQREVLTYPERSTLDELKNIAKKLLNRGGYVKDPINWPNGLLAVGLMDMFAAGLIEEKDTEAVSLLKEKWEKNGYKVIRPDDALAGHAFFMKGFPEAKKIYDNLLNMPMDSRGSILYNPRVKDEILADMIGMTVPLLMDFKNYDMAAKQITNFLDYGFDEKTGLPYHGYNLKKEEKIEDKSEEKSGDKSEDKSEDIAVGILGWGRAVGWILMGEAYFLKYAGKNHKDYGRIREAFIGLSSTVLSYQKFDGLFGWQLQGKDSHIDTSATAMILNAMIMATDAIGATDSGAADMTGTTDIGGIGGIGAADLDDVALKGVEALSEYISDGQIYGGLAECQGPGMHPQVYGAYPWTLGPFLSLKAGLNSRKNI